MAIRRVTGAPKIKVPAPKDASHKNKEITRSKPKHLSTDHVAQEEGVVMVRASRYAEGVVTDEVMTEHRVPVPSFSGPVARTRVSMGVTKSLGGYEFARLDVAVELPCHPNPDDLTETNLYAAAKVDEFIQRELDAIQPLAAPSNPSVDSRIDMSALTNGN